MLLLEGLGERYYTSLAPVGANTSRSSNSNNNNSRINKKILSISTALSSVHYHADKSGGKHLFFRVANDDILDYRDGDAPQIFTAVDHLNRAASSKNSSSDIFYYSHISNNRSNLYFGHSSNSSLDWSPARRRRAPWPGCCRIFSLVLFILLLLWTGPACPRAPVPRADAWDATATIDALFPFSLLPVALALPPSITPPPSCPDEVVLKFGVFGADALRPGVERANRALRDGLRIGVAEHNFMPCMHRVVPSGRLELVEEWLAPDLSNINAAVGRLQQAGVLALLAPFGIDVIAPAAPALQHHNISIVAPISGVTSYYEKFSTGIINLLPPPFFELIGLLRYIVLHIHMKRIAFLTTETAPHFGEDVLLLAQRVLRDIGLGGLVYHFQINSQKRPEELQLRQLAQARPQALLLWGDTHLSTSSAVSKILARIPELVVAAPLVHAHTLQHIAMGLTRKAIEQVTFVIVVAAPPPDDALYSVVSRFRNTTGLPHPRRRPFPNNLNDPSPAPGSSSNTNNYNRNLMDYIEATTGLSLFGKSDSSPLTDVYTTFAYSLTLWLTRMIRSAVASRQERLRASGSAPASPVDIFRIQREDFISGVFSSHLFEAEDYVSGPFHPSCGEMRSRTSLCECHNGGRTVFVAHLTRRNEIMSLSDLKLELIDTAEYHIPFEQRGTLEGALRAMPSPLIQMMIRPNTNISQLTPSISNLEETSKKLSFEYLKSAAASLKNMSYYNSPKEPLLLSISYNAYTHETSQDTNTRPKLNISAPTAVMKEALDRYHVTAALGAILTYPLDEEVMLVPNRTRFSLHLPKAHVPHLVDVSPEEREAQELKEHLVRTYLPATYNNTRSARIALIDPLYPAPFPATGFRRPVLNVATVPLDYELHLFARFIADRRMKPVLLLIDGSNDLEDERIKTWRFRATEQLFRLSLHTFGVPFGNSSTEVIRAGSAPEAKDALVNMLKSVVEGDKRRSNGTWSPTSPLATSTVIGIVSITPADVSDANTLYSLRELDGLMRASPNLHMLFSMAHILVLFDAFVRTMEPANLHRMYLATPLPPWGGIRLFKEFDNKTGEGQIFIPPGANIYSSLMPWTGTVLRQFFSVVRPSRRSPMAIIGFVAQRFLQHLVDRIPFQLSAEALLRMAYMTSVIHIGQNLVFGPFSDTRCSDYKNNRSAFNEGNPEDSAHLERRKMSPSGQGEGFFTSGLLSQDIGTIDNVHVNLNVVNESEALDDAIICEMNLGPRKLYLYTLHQMLPLPVKLFSNRTLNVTRDIIGTRYDAKAQFFFNTNGRIIYRPLPETSREEDDFTLWIIIIVSTVLALALIALAIILIAYCFCFKQRSLKHAPSDPSRPLTLVFTDIQSSTTLWAEIPDAMAVAMAHHHSAIRQLISLHHGYEVKTIGDAFMVAFIRAIDAVAFAADLQFKFYRESCEALHAIEDVDHSGAGQEGVGPEELSPDKRERKERKKKKRRRKHANRNDGSSASRYLDTSDPVRAGEEHVVAISIQRAKAGNSGNPGLPTSLQDVLDEANNDFDLLPNYLGDANRGGCRVGALAHKKNIDSYSSESETDSSEYSDASTEDEESRHTLTLFNQNCNAMSDVSYSSSDRGTPGLSLKSRVKFTSSNALLAGNKTIKELFATISSPASKPLLQYSSSSSGSMDGSQDSLPDSLSTEDDFIISHPLEAFRPASPRGDRPSPLLPLVGSIASVDGGLDLTNDKGYSKKKKTNRKGRSRAKNTAAGDIAKQAAAGRSNARSADHGYSRELLLFGIAVRAIDTLYQELELEKVHEEEYFNNAMQDDWAEGGDPGNREETKQYDFLSINLTMREYRTRWCGLRVRVGVHTGFADIIKDPITQYYDYYGTMVNTASRVESTAHGGQVLISEATAWAVVLEECEMLLLSSPSASRQRVAARSSAIDATERGGNDLMNRKGVHKDKYRDSIAGPAGSDPRTITPSWAKSGGRRRAAGGINPESSIALFSNNTSFSNNNGYIPGDAAVNPMSADEQPPEDQVVLNETNRDMIRDAIYNYGGDSEAGDQGHISDLLSYLLRRIYGDRSGAGGNCLTRCCTDEGRGPQMTSTLKGGRAKGFCIIRNYTCSIKGVPCGSQSSVGTSASTVYQAARGLEELSAALDAFGNSWQADRSNEDGPDQSEKGFSIREAIIEQFLLNAGNRNYVDLFKEIINMNDKELLEMHGDDVLREGEASDSGAKGLSDVFLPPSLGLQPPDSDDDFMQSDPPYVRLPLAFVSEVLGAWRRLLSEPGAELITDHAANGDYGAEDQLRARAAASRSATSGGLRMGGMKDMSVSELNASGHDMAYFQGPDAAPWCDYSGMTQGIEALGGNAHARADKLHYLSELFKPVTSDPKGMAHHNSTASLNSLRNRASCGALNNSKPGTCLGDAAPHDNTVAESSSSSGPASVYEDAPSKALCIDALATAPSDPASMTPAAPAANVAARNGSNHNDDDNDHCSHETAQSATRAPSPMMQANEPPAAAANDGTSRAASSASHTAKVIFIEQGLSARDSWQRADSDERRVNNEGGGDPQEASGAETAADRSNGDPRRHQHACRKQQFLPGRLLSAVLLKGLACPLLIRQIDTVPCRVFPPILGVNKGSTTGCYDPHGRSRRATMAEPNTLPGTGDGWREPDQPAAWSINNDYSTNTPGHNAANGYSPSLFNLSGTHTGAQGTPGAVFRLENSFSSWVLGGAQGAGNGVPEGGDTASAAGRQDATDATRDGPALMIPRIPLNMMDGNSSSHGLGNQEHGSMATFPQPTIIITDGGGSRQGCPSPRGASSTQGDAFGLTAPGGAPSCGASMSPRGLIHSLSRNTLIGLAHLAANSSAGNLSASQNSYLIGAAMALDSSAPGHDLCVAPPSHAADSGAIVNPSALVPPQYVQAPPERGGGGVTLASAGERPPGRHPREIEAIPTKNDIIVLLEVLLSILPRQQKKQLVLKLAQAWRIEPFSSPAAGDPDNNDTKISALVLSAEKRYSKTHGDIKKQSTRIKMMIRKSFIAIKRVMGMMQEAAQPENQPAAGSSSSSHKAAAEGPEAHATAGPAPSYHDLVAELSRRQRDFVSLNQQLLLLQWHAEGRVISPHYAQADGGTGPGLGRSPSSHSLLSPKALLRPPNAVSLFTESLAGVLEPLVRKRYIKDFIAEKIQLRQLGAVLQRTLARAAAKESAAHATREQRRCRGSIGRAAREQRSSPLDEQAQEGDSTAQH